MVVTYYKAVKCSLNALKRIKEHYAFVKGFLGPDNRIWSHAYKRVEGLKSFN